LVTIKCWKAKPTVDYEERPLHRDCWARPAANQVVAIEAAMASEQRQRQEDAAKSMTDAADG